MNYTKLAGKVRKKIVSFSGELTRGLSKVCGRLVREMIYGIQASKSVMLTDIGRSLEEPISIKKVEERLSRQLSRKGMASIVQGNLLGLAKGLIKDDTLLILDPSDIRKKYAKKMEHLALVRDGSEKEIGNGYSLCEVIATDVDTTGMIPLVHRLYSTVAPDFTSENREILDVMDSVASKIDNRGIWVVDRGGDRRNLLIPMMDSGHRFLIRMVGNRHLVHDQSVALASDIAKECSCPYMETIVKVEDGKERVRHLEFGYRNVKLPNVEHSLYLLVVRGFGQEPMMLLTTEPLRKNRKVLWHWVRAYMRRWAIEETIRFVKQSYDIENIRVMSYRSLQNLMVLVLAATYFASVVLEGRARLNVMAGNILKAAQRVFGIPDFQYYAIADGLMNIFSRCPGRLEKPLPKDSKQPSLFDDLH